MIPGQWGQQGREGQEANTEYNDGWLATSDDGAPSQGILWKIHGAFYRQEHQSIYPPIPITPGLRAASRLFLLSICHVLPAHAWAKHKRVVKKTQVPVPLRESCLPKLHVTSETGPNTSVTVCKTSEALGICLREEQLGSSQVFLIQTITTITPQCVHTRVCIHKIFIEVELLGKRVCICHFDGGS